MNDLSPSEIRRRFEEIGDELRALPDDHVELAKFRIGGPGEDGGSSYRPPVEPCAAMESG